MDQVDDSISFHGIAVSISYTHRCIFSPFPILQFFSLHFAVISVSGQRHFTFSELQNWLFLYSSMTAGTAPAFPATSLGASCVLRWALWSFTPVMSGTPRRSVLFNIFVSNMDRGVECALSKFGDDTRAYKAKQAAEISVTRETGRSCRNCAEHEE